jgi:hypothetical protein
MVCVIEALASFGQASAVADEPTVCDYRRCTCGACDECQAAEEISRRFGPCPCEPRKTLFQWSYGTSFDGGPPGWDEPLVTDRPDFTEASTTVGRNVRQLEMGYTFARDSQAGATTNFHSFPETLFRWGVFAEWFELRAAWNYAVETSNAPGVADLSGAEDLYLGVKLGLTPQEGWLPEMALVPQMTVPTGGSNFNAGEALPGVNWLYAWDINEFLSTGGSSQFNRTLDDVTGEAYLEFAQSWTIGYGLSERLSAYTEWFAFVPMSAETVRPEHYFDGGFTYLVSNNIQLDVRAGVGLNEAAADFFAGPGLSVRF